MNDKKILQMAGYEKIDEDTYLLESGYEIALIYFENDYENLEYLKSISEEEKNEIKMVSTVRLHDRYASIELGKEISEATIEDDDYEGVLEFAKELIKKNKTVIFSGLYEIAPIGNSLGVRLESTQLKNNGLRKGDMIFVSVRFGTKKEL